MGKPTILGLLIGMVLVSAFAGILGLTFSDISSNYNVTNMDDINISRYDQLNALHSQAEDIKGEVSDIEQPSGALDILGGFFYNAYKVLISIPQSFNLLYDMSNAAMEDTDLGAGGVILQQALITIIVFVIFIGIILAILLKRDMI